MFQKALDLINKSQTIYIVSHINPDGDAIGSSYAMCLALKKLGKDVQVVMPSFSDTFSFLPNIDDKVNKIDKVSYDLLICTDCSNKDRIALSQKDYDNAKFVLMFDHHVPSEKFADVSCINHNLPAACELIYEFLKFIDIEIDVDIATYLYVGILTDTGNFNYASTRSETLKIAAELMDKGIDFSQICKKVNDTIKESKLKLIAKTIDNMEVYFDGKLRYSYISLAELKNLNINDEDAEGMTNYLRSVEHTEVAVYVRQKEDGSNKVSIRSGGTIDVSKIATYFGGGGHKRAAGYTMKEEIDIAKERLINVVEVMLSGNTPS